MPPFEYDFASLTASDPEIEIACRIRSQEDVIPIQTQSYCAVHAAALEIGVEGESVVAGGVGDDHAESGQRQGCAVGFYLHGNGVETNLSEGIAWIRKSVEQDSSLGQFNLGVVFAWGIGVETNLPEAVKLYQLAAEQDEIRAQYNLAICYDNGTGVETNRAEALKWFHRAAEQGDANAQYGLGWRYEEGQDVDRDVTQAVGWYRKAAEQEHPESEHTGALAKGGRAVVVVSAPVP